MTTNRRSRTIYGQSREDVSDGFSVRVQELAGGVTYVGKAEIGSSESDPVWRILRLTESGQNTDVQYADGDDNFDNVWADRASLSYS
jgi:hypothetical protein